MLTKRTNILFDKEVWNKLVRLAEAKKVSVSNIIRETINDRFEEEDTLKKRRQAFENILKHRPKPYPGKIDYKELINAGRKSY